METYQRESRKLSSIYYGDYLDVCFKAGSGLERVSGTRLGQRKLGLFVDAS